MSAKLAYPTAIGPVRSLTDEPADGSAHGGATRRMDIVLVSSL